MDNQNRKHQPGVFDPERFRREVDATYWADAHRLVSFMDGYATATLLRFNPAREKILDKLSDDNRRKFLKIEKRLHG